VWSRGWIELATFDVNRTRWTGGGRFSVFHGSSPLHDVIVPLRKDRAELLENFDTHQLTAIAQLMDRTTELDYRHAALLRAETVSNLGQASVDKARSHPQPY